MPFVKSFLRHAGNFETTAFISHISWERARTTFANVCTWIPKKKADTPRGRTADRYAANASKRVVWRSDGAGETYSGTIVSYSITTQVINLAKPSFEAAFGTLSARCRLCRCCCCLLRGKAVYHFGPCSNQSSVQLITVPCFIGRKKGGGEVIQHSHTIKKHFKLRKKEQEKKEKILKSDCKIRAIGAITPHVLISWGCKSTYWSLKGSKPASLLSKENKV